MKIQQKITIKKQMMTKREKLSNGERALLGLTALFVCVLLILRTREPRTIPVRPVVPAAEPDAETASELFPAETEPEPVKGEPPDNPPKEPGSAVKSTSSTVTNVPAGDSPGGGTASPDDAAPVEPPPVNLNTATAAELAELPGIGPALADRIIAWREKHGPFPAPESLTEVSGIGPAKLAALEGLITVSGEPDRTPAGNSTVERGGDAP